MMTASTPLAPPLRLDTCEGGGRTLVSRRRWHGSPSPQALANSCQQTSPSPSFPCPSSPPRPCPSPSVVNHMAFRPSSPSHSVQRKGRRGNADAKRLCGLKRRGKGGISPPVQRLSPPSRPSSGRQSQGGAPQNRLLLVPAAQALQNPRHPNAVPPPPSPFCSLPLHFLNLSFPRGSGELLCV